MENQKELLRALPKVDECLLWLKGEKRKDLPSRIVKESVQEAVAEERKKILDGVSGTDIKKQDEWVQLFLARIERKLAFNLRRVINGTGVVIHTNLGRSLLPGKAQKMLEQAAGYYSNLEFDLETGNRGSRYSLVEDIICDLTGAEAALVVNNNAAAVLLVLDTLCKGTEVIVSRGQLVEIGGSFRIPDVMAKSGADLVEVGATNRTHRYDYEQAITERTSMLLRVHTSNFRLIGFTSDVSAEELADIGKQHNLVTMEDLGSGSFIDLSRYGLMKEPTVQDVVKAGIDVVTFSGDKLLGGPQAGIIVGTKDVIARIKRNPLNRALRIDKFTLASLETILRYYYDLQGALANIPTLSMLTVDQAILKERAMRVIAEIQDTVSEKCKVELVQTNSRVGGGAMPECNLPSWAVQLDPLKLKVSKMEKLFRELQLPIIGRIENEKFLIDVRTIQEEEVLELCELIKEFFT
ncbi:L-seryl-tRNA(Sec) selenium transferase [Desulfosediminicola ganghwensis]|uniref:L-seryl-tRNA(Sec) selenium transferase n=1 Tax=Desulfosediminicola ganghwensis TaxID=2569540 RepID=UPI0010AD5D8E|nr:L-seryl-tRNA(Sec) selenium transferase [Desulfosediminicola ganghwensis]